MGETIKVIEPDDTVAKGAAGMRSQVGGASATVSSMAEATGGIGRGRFVETFR